MQVHIHFHGAIDRRGLPQDHTMEVSDCTTVDAMISLLGYTSTQSKFIIPMIKGERCHPERVLQVGEQVDLLTPFGGG